jgi:hypothetical protein
MPANQNNTNYRYSGTDRKSFSESSRKTYREQAEKEQPAKRITITIPVTAATCT